MGRYESERPVGLYIHTEEDDVFFPALGQRCGNTGVLQVGATGYYWSAVPGSTIGNPHNMNFNEVADIYLESVKFERGYALSMRPLLDVEE